MHIYASLHLCTNRKHPAAPIEWSKLLQDEPMGILVTAGEVVDDIVNQTEGDPRSWWLF